MQKLSMPLLTVVVIGATANIFMADWLRSQKTAIANYESNRPTMFYAGMDKFLSGVNWMTLVQWQANHSDMDDATAELLYRKFNALTNLDPLFLDAYLDGALALAPVKPELASALMKKALSMGMEKNWKVPFTTGFIHLTYLKDPTAAEGFFKQAVEAKDCPSYVARAMVRSRCMQRPGNHMYAVENWSNYYKSLSDKDRAAQASVISEIMANGQEIIADSEKKLLEESDESKREAIITVRDRAIAVMAEYKGLSPALEPQP